MNEKEYILMIIFVQKKFDIIRIYILPNLV